MAVIVTPVAIGLASSLGSIRGPLWWLSCLRKRQLSHPIGYQTNTLVYSAGGYKFFDFVRIGAVMNVVVFAIAMIMIPIVWPF